MIKALNKHVFWEAVKSRITFSTICRNNDKQISRWGSRKKKKPKIYLPHKINICIKKTGQNSKDNELTQKELIRFWSIQYWRGLKLVASEWVKTGRYISVGTDGSTGLIYSCGSEWNSWFVSHRSSSHKVLNWTLYIYLNTLAYQNMMLLVWEKSIDLFRWIKHLWLFFLNVQYLRCCMRHLSSNTVF